MWFRKKSGKTNGQRKCFRLPLSSGRTLSGTLFASYILAGTDSSQEQGKANKLKSLQERVSKLSWRILKEILDMVLRRKTNKSMHGVTDKDHLKVIHQLIPMVGEAPDPMFMIVIFHLLSCSPWSWSEWYVSGLRFTSLGGPGPPQRNLLPKRHLHLPPLPSTSGSLDDSLSDLADSYCTNTMSQWLQTNISIPSLANLFETIQWF